MHKQEFIWSWENEMNSLLLVCPSVSRELEYHSPTKEMVIGQSITEVQLV